MEQVSQDQTWYSFLILSGLFFLSLFSEILCNDKPYIMSYNGKWYFPIFQFYSEKEFGGKYLTEADYLALRNSPLFKNGDNWMVFPPIPHSPLHSYIDLAGSPLIHPLPIIGWVQILLPGMCLPVFFTAFVYVCSFL